MALAPVAASGRTEDPTAQDPETPLMSVGFAPFTDDTQNIKVIDASTLEVGESRFQETSVKLKLRGFTTRNEETRASNIDRMMLDVSFAPFHDTLFHAWSFQNDASTSCSCPSAMTVPVKNSHGLNMLLSIQHQSDSVLRQVPIRLAVEPRDDVPKLLKGHYFVGLPGPDGALPHWNEYVVQTEPGIPDVERLAHSASGMESAESQSGPIFMFSVGMPG